MKSFVYAVLLGALLGTTSAIEARAPDSSSSSGTSISTTASANASMCATGLAQIYSGYSTDPALQCVCATQFLNWVSTSNPPTRTITRTQPSGVTTQTFVSAGSTITTSFQFVTTESFTVTGNFGNADGFDWYGSAQPPCCSSCTIAAQTVNLFYWPTPAVLSQPTSFVSNGYTFISPSVYMGFTSLSAYDYCGNVGNIYTSTTFSFGPSELSTVGSPTPRTRTTTATETDLTGGVSTSTNTVTESFGGPASILNYRDLDQNCSTISGYSFLASMPFALNDVTFDPCHPTIILPPQIKSLDPAWARCENNPIGGFYDPPFPLTATGPLQPFDPSTSASPAPTAASDKGPTSTTTQAQPTSTSSADPVPPSSSTPLPPAPSSTTVPVAPSSTPVPEPPASTSTPPTEPSLTTSAPSVPIVSLPLPVDTTTAPSVPIVPVSPPVDTTTAPSVPIVSIPPPVDTATVPSTVAVSPSSQVEPTPSNPAPVQPSSIVASGDPAPSNASPVEPTNTPTDPGVPSPSPSTPPLPIIGSQTLTPGGSPITVSGTVLSLDPSGSSVVINGVLTAPLSSVQPEISSPAIVDTPTLSPGGSPITVGGNTFSLQPSGDSVVVNGTSTIPLSSAQGLISSATQAAIGSVIASVVGVTTSVTVIQGSTFIIQDSSTVPIASATSGSGNSTLLPFTASGSRSTMKMEVFVIGILGCLGMIM